MLIHSATTPAIHHYLLLFINSKATFSSWQIILSRYWVKVYSGYLDEHVISGNVKVKVLQVVMYIIDEHMYALVTSASNSEMLIVEVQPNVSLRGESIKKLCQSC